MLIRAVYTGKISPTARREYDALAEKFGLDPTLRKLLDNPPGK